MSQASYEAPKTRFDNSIAKALARAYRWKQKLDDGTYATMVELAKAERINESYVTRLIRLNLLAPDIVEAALDGRTPLTVQILTEPIRIIGRSSERDWAAKASPDWPRVTGVMECGWNRDSKPVMPDLHMVFDDAA